MPRLLQITDKPEGGGGIRRVVAQHRALLERRGWAVDLLRVGSTNHSTGDGDWVVPVELSRRRAPDAASLGALRRAASAADVVHLHLGFSSLSPDVVAALAESAPLVASLHDVSPFDGLRLPEMGTDARARQTDAKYLLARWWFWRTRRATWAGLLAGTRLMLAPSRYLADLAVAAGMLAARVRVVPHALESVAPAERSPSACPPVVAYAGLVSEDKGVTLLLDAFTRLRAAGAQLEVLGAGEALPALRSRVHRAGLGERVHFRGAVRPSQVVKAFAAARVVAHPSLVPEGFGLVGIEAMQQGRPVAGFGLGGSGDWLVPNVTGLVADKPEPGALADVLDRLLSDGALADRLGAAGREHVLRRFSPELVGAQLDCALREGAGLRGPEAGQ